MHKLAIVTRNAMHGGVETMIALHQRHFEATVFVTGGFEHRDTCPFEYVYIGGPDTEGAAARLARMLQDYDAVIYHWPPGWAVQAIAASGIPSIEVVHRTDTNDCDKRVPTLIATHSQYLADVIARECRREAVVIPHGIDVDRFPIASGECIGGITSYYYPVKGLDVFFDAWVSLRQHFPAQKVRFYGAGSGLATYREMAADRGLDDVELLGPVSTPEAHIGEFRLVVQPSRIEGMPFATLEALAANVPVVCSALPGMIEFNALARERGVVEPLTLFAPEDAGDLARKIEAILASRQPRADTRDYIRANYGAQSHCARYETIVERVIESSRGHRSAAGESSPVAQIGAAQQRAEHAANEPGAVKRARGSRWIERYRRVRSALFRS